MTLDKNDKFTDMREWVLGEFNVCPIHTGPCVWVDERQGATSYLCLPLNRTTGVVERLDFFLGKHVTWIFQQLPCTNQCDFCLDHRRQTLHNIGIFDHYVFRHRWDV